MRQFQNASNSMKEEVDYDLNWQGVIARILKVPPKKQSYSSSYDVYVTEFHPRKKKKVVDMTYYATWSIAMIKEELRKRNIRPVGNKKELIEQLRNKV